MSQQANIPQRAQLVVQQLLEANYDSSVYAIIAQQLTIAAVNKRNPQLNKKETQLLQAINLPIPEDIWTEYQKLSEAQRDKELSTTQRKRLLELTDVIEDAEVKRYKNLIKLGKEWKMTMPELKAKLGIN